MQNEFKRGVKSYNKKKKVFGLITIFSVFLVGFLFLKANPHFENPVTIFTGSNFEKRAEYELTEAEKVKTKKLAPLNKRWLAHIQKDQKELVLGFDTELRQIDMQELSRGSLLSVNNTNSQNWLIYDPGHEIIVFNKEGKKIVEIDLENEQKISIDEHGILLGENNVEMNDGLEYIERLRWLDYEGQLINEFKFKDLIVLEGINNSYIDELYLSMDFCEDPEIKLIRVLGEDNIEYKRIDLRIEEGIDIYIKSLREFLALRNEERIILLKNEKEQLVEVVEVFETDNSEIEDFFLLDETLIILTKNETNYSLMILDYSVDKIEVRKERPLRGELLDINQVSPDEFTIATTTHIYEFDKEGSKVFRSPWGQVEAGAFDIEGNYFLTFEEKTNKFKLYNRKE